MTLKKLYKQLKEVDAEIKEINRRIEEMPRLKYYAIFSGDAELKSDIADAKKILKLNLDLRHAILENISLAVNKELNNTSLMMRENTLNAA